MGERKSSEFTDKVENRYTGDHKDADRGFPDQCAGRTRKDRLPERDDPQQGVSDLTD